jgi:hypothetical protein
LSLPSPHKIEISLKYDRFCCLNHFHCPLHLHLILSFHHLDFLRCWRPDARIFLFLLCLSISQLSLNHSLSPSLGLCRTSTVLLMVCSLIFCSCNNNLFNIKSVTYYFKILLYLFISSPIIPSAGLIKGNLF